MVLIGARFVQVSESKNQAEAEYRYVLTRLRDNGESIALIRGEEEERVGVDRSFGKVLKAWRDIAIQTIKTTVVSQTSGFIALVLPVVSRGLDEPRSSHAAASAFTIVQGAFNWLVDNYPRMADWTASARLVWAAMGQMRSWNGTGGICSVAGEICHARRRRTSSASSARDVARRLTDPRFRRDRPALSMPRLRRRGCGVTLLRGPLNLTLKDKLKASLDAA